MAQQQDLVLNWLGGAYCPPGQAPLDIGSKIDSFETDFSNGYLFGQILSQYGISDSINTFTRKNNKEGKCHNFYQVEDGLRVLKVPFDAKLIHNVMNEEPGASLKLLNLMRKAFDAHFSKSDKTVTGLKQKTLDSKVKQVKDLAVTLPKIHKDYGVDGPTFKGKNFMRIEEKLLKYEVARANLEKKAQRDDLAEKNMLQSIQQQKRQDAMLKLKENRQFMNEWEATGKQNWKANREVRAQEIARSMYFDDREVKIYKDKLNRELDYNTNDMKYGITEFHENLRKLGVEENITIQEAVQRQEQKKGIPPGQIQNFSYAATMNKIKETKNNNEFAGKERERRNRKLKVDQIKIQETLDAQKQEELLIQKLLANQQEEQKNSYTRWRQEQCHEIALQNKIQKAEDIHQQKLIKTAQIENEMKDGAEAVQEERTVRHEAQKTEIKEVRREEKAKRRRINIEIASEIIDLIMDVAEEAADFQEQHERDSVEDDRLLRKETWRHWMNIFNDGKKVSEQNLVITKDESDVTGVDQDPMAQMLGIGVKKITPTQILDKIKNEQIFVEFMQYLSMCGPLNLKLVAPDKWNNISQIVNKEKNTFKDRQINLSCLDGINIPQNHELGAYIETLYFGNGSIIQGGDAFRATQFNQTSSQITSTTNANKISMLKTESKLDVVQEEPIMAKDQEIPTWHTLKMCLMGKAYSGKKTIAQNMAEEYNQITVFDMSEILREALGFVSTEKKEEVVDTKAKGKGKAAEAAPAELFVGQDTTLYKDIATKILQQINVTTGQDKIPNKDTDVLSLVSDDSLLINLLIQKLKLTFTDPPVSEEDQETKMRANLEKETELLEQLAEAKENEVPQAETNAKAPPAKGGKGAKNAVKSAKEIQDDIDDLMSVEKNGWILLDFPRNINQAKLMESIFTGFKSVTDAPKSFEQSNFEVWSKFADADADKNEEACFMAQNSFFEGIFMINTSKDECLRRGQQRKVDPTTNQVYHMVDSPPPQTDAKLVERLTDFFGNYSCEDDMIAKLDNNHLQFADQEQLLSEFYKEFGMLDYEECKGIHSFDVISVDEKKEKTEVYGQIQSKIKQILGFKQIQKNRDYESLKKKMKHEEEMKIVEDAENKEKEKEEKPEEKEEEMKEQSQINSLQLETEQNIEQEAMMKNTFSKNSDGPSDAKSFSRMKTKTGQKKREYTPEYKIYIWEQMINSYMQDGMLTLNQIKKQMDSVTSNLNFCQSEFIQFLERPDSNQESITEFIKSFNQFSCEFPDLRQDDQTKEELMQRVETLSSKLWKNIEDKKDQSLEEIRRQGEDGWSVQEMKQVCKNMANMIEIEIKKFNVVYSILVEQDPIVELDAEILVKKQIERGVKPYDFANRMSPIMQQVVISLMTKMDDLFTKTYKEHQFNANPNALILEQERNIFIYRLALINSWCLVQLEEISTYSHEVYMMMDDWVVEAVSSENYSMMQILDQISDFIRSSQMTMNDYDFQIKQTQLYGRIEPKQFFSNSVPLYMQDVRVPDAQVEISRFNVDHLGTLFSQIKQNTGIKGNYDFLDQQTFLNVMMIAFRQGKVPPCWKFINFNQIYQLCQKFRINPLPLLDQGNDSPMQYQSQFAQSVTRSFQQAGHESNRQWIEWKKMFTHFTLMNSTLPTEEQLAEYKANLEAVQSDGYITCEQFVKVCAWFDNFEGKADTSLTAKWLQEFREVSLMSEFEDEADSESKIFERLDGNRLEKIKKLLFNVHRVKIGEDKLNVEEYIDNLANVSSQMGQITYSEAMFN